jgi:hypothetical protein
MPAITFNPGPMPAAPDPQRLRVFMDGTEIHVRQFQVRQDQFGNAEVMIEAALIPVMRASVPATPALSGCVCGAAATGVLRGQPGHSSWCGWRTS